MEKQYQLVLDSSLKRRRAAEGPADGDAVSPTRPLVLDQSLRRRAGDPYRPQERLSRLHEDTTALRPSAGTEAERRNYASRRRQADREYMAAKTQSAPFDAGAYLPVSRAVERSNAEILYGIASDKVKADRHTVGDIYSNDFAAREAERIRREDNERELDRASEALRRLGSDTENSLGNVGSRLVATRRKAGPVIEVNNADGAIRIDDAVTAVDNNIQFLGSTSADVFQLLQVNINTLTVAVDLLPAILAVTLVKGVEPIEELGILHPVELHQVTHQVHINHGTRDTTIEVLLKHFLSLLGVTHIAHVLFVHGVEITALDPAALETSLLQLPFDVLVGVDNQALGIRDAVTQ